MAKKIAPVESPESTLGSVVMVYSKSSSHWCALLQPKFVTISEMRFLEGTQVTGKEGHRMEKKRTLIPCDHIASIVEFATEEDLWSEPQPKHLRLPDEIQPSAPLTSHEQPHQNHGHGGGGRKRRHRDNRPQGGFNKGHDNRYQGRYDSNRGGGGGREGNR